MERNYQHEIEIKTVNDLSNYSTLLWNMWC